MKAGTYSANKYNASKSRHGTAQPRTDQGLACVVIDKVRAAVSVKATNNV